MPIVIKVLYFGVVRLTLSKKEDIFEFQDIPTFEELIQSIGQKYGTEILEECKRQAFFIQKSQSEISEQVRFSQDQHLGMEHNSIIKVVSMITGG